MSKKESLKKTIILLLSYMGNFILAAMYAYVWIELYHQRIIWTVKLYFKGHMLMIFIYLVLLFFFSSTFGGLKIGYLKPADVFFSQIFAIFCTGMISYFQLSLMAVRLVYARPMILMIIFQIIFAGIWTILCDRLYRVFVPPRKLLLLYGDHPIEDILNKFSSRKDKYRVVKCMHIEEGMETVQNEAISKEYDAVVIWDIPTSVRNVLLKFCYSRDIRIYMMPKISDVIIKGSDQLHLFDTPILLTREYSLKVEQRFAKRLIDIVFAVLLTVITSPIMLITAIVIKVYDQGPVLYKQTRCTVHGKEFSILKFRSMKVDAEKDGVARLAAKNDSRITPVGKFIRAVRIDELPQLFNILKGDMSFIGPRPERPEIIKQYMEYMPEFAFRMKVKAGLAGYAQVYGKYNTTPYDKVKLDLSYIQNYTVWLDIKLMLLTLKIIFKPESTEGVDNSQITAMKNDAGEDSK